jgi:hypothetical protein
MYIDDLRRGIKIQMVSQNALMSANNNILRLVLLK